MNTNKLDNLEEMDTFLEAYNSSIVIMANRKYKKINNE